MPPKARTVLGGKGRGIRLFKRPNGNGKPKQDINGQVRRLMVNADLRRVINDNGEMKRFKDSRPNQGQVPRDNPREKLLGRPTDPRPAFMALPSNPRRADNIRATRVPPVVRKTEGLAINRVPPTSNVIIGK